MNNAPAIRSAGIPLAQAGGLPPVRSAAAPAPAAKPAQNGSAPAPRQVTVVIRPNVRDRWSSTLLAYYTPERVETVARGALSGNLYAIWQMFDLMEQTWPELSTCMNELKDQAIAEIMENYTLKPPVGDKRKVETEAQRRCDIVEHILDNMDPDIAGDENDFEDTLRDLFDMVGKAISILEMNFADDPETADIKGTATQIVPLISTHWVNPRYYGYPMGEYVNDRLMLNVDELLRNNPGSPFVATGAQGARWQDFPPDKFILGIFKQKSGHPVSGATFRVLINLWAMSNFTWEWYLNFVQIFGVPLRIAKIDPNAPDAVKTEVDGLLADMGSTGYIRLPTGNDIEVKEAAKSGDNSIHQAFLKYCDEICRKRILGQTLTGGEGQHGTNALGKIHATVRNDRIQTAAKRAVKILNTQVIPAIGRANFGDARLLPKFETPEKDNEDPLEKMQRVQIFTTIAPMEEEELYDIAGFRVPEAGAKTVGGQTQPGLNAPPGTPGAGGPGAVGTPQLPNAAPAKLNPEKDAAATATARAAASAAESTDAIGGVLHEMILPLLNRLEKIAAIDDPGIQQHMIEKLLKDFPQIAAAITADDSLAKKLSPQLESALLAGLNGRSATAQAGDAPGHEFRGNQWTGSLRESVEKVKSVLSGKSDEEAYAKVSPEVAAQIKSATGKDVSGYQHFLDHESLVHIHKQHGVGNEDQPGHLPVTKDDIEKIPLIVSSPDKVEAGNKSGRGAASVMYSKRFNGTTYYVEEMWHEDHLLAAKTMFKRSTQ
jgi:hypothetical protein